ncbi:hypothetical protein CC1G_02676 [Coprinopsis cinerea okayama7|uniref:Uncharacterized protein n=1 Tax=Coprinopsis cinerea (strain Okayama-7 / 130 / ATCC MYA-4618 / FGSC 9003) TaxID=240176 RepID=A8PBL5_COPC7|nr:hypothetical protein CC1G_02676 [Coprinopsis cinerea okayama7\|eukprot:XP_001840213.1 hypothetical protein CC1G_02676 [Coprinopsis cinerea okayama7\
MSLIFNKDRLYLALYERPGWNPATNEDSERFHFAILLIPKNPRLDVDPDCPNSPRDSFVIHAVRGPNDKFFSFNAKPVVAKTTNLSGLIFLGKVTQNRDYVRDILDKGVAIEKVEGYNCRTWARAAIQLLQKEKVITDPVALATDVDQMLETGRMLTANYIELVTPTFVPTHLADGHLCKSALQGL